MAVQAYGTCLYNGVPYAIAGALGKGLFEPRNHFELNHFSTNSWSGFVVAYAIEDGKLTLHEIENVKDRQLLETMLGVPIAFTGGLLLCDKFDESLYEHMRVAPAFKFKRVLEVKFDSGRVVDMVDRSQDMVLFRQNVRPLFIEFSEMATISPKIRKQEMEYYSRMVGSLDQWEEKWLNERFKLDYSDVLPPEMENPSTPEDGGT